MSLNKIDKKKGIIIKGIGGLYYVKCQDDVIRCKARGKFRYNKLVPMVGDIVDVEVNKNEGSIERIYERKNQLIRPFVSNVSQAFVVETLKNPELDFNLLNNFLMLCESQKLKICVCFNKIDLINPNDDKFSYVDIIKNAGYDVVLLNAKEGLGISELKSKINGEVTVFCGPSGVGKSTIFNKILGKDIMETGNISLKSSRGKHTTRHSELIEYLGGFLVDTPGFSSLDTSFIQKENLKEYFPEFDFYNENCKFSNCMHYKEPKCGVKEAVQNGDISSKRYEFYVKTLENIISRRDKR